MSQGAVNFSFANYGNCIQFAYNFLQWGTIRIHEFHVARVETSKPSLTGTFHADYNLEFKL